MPHVQASIDGQVQRIPQSMTARAWASDATHGQHHPDPRPPSGAPPAYVRQCRRL